MKKSKVLIIAILFGLSISTAASASTAYFAIEGPQALLDTIGGFQFDVEDLAGSNPTFSLNVYYDDGAGVLGLPPAVPKITGTSPFGSEPWDVTSTSTGVLGIQNDFVSLVPGVVASAAATPEIVFTNWVFSDFNNSDGGFALTFPYNITESALGGGDRLYTFNAVPIPPTVLLLGAGLVGLVGIRRRVKS